MLVTNVTNYKMNVSGHIVTCISPWTVEDLSQCLCQYLSLGIFPDVHKEWCKEGDIHAHSNNHSEISQHVHWARKTPDHRDLLRTNPQILLSHTQETQEHICTGLSSRFGLAEKKWSRKRGKAHLHWLACIFISSALFVELIRYITAFIFY